MPGHADEKRAVVTEVGRPPFLRIGHQREEVLFQGLQVELLELLGIVERRAKGVGQGGVLVENLEVQLVRPPVPVRPAAMGRVRMHNGTFARVVDFRIHNSLP